MMMDNKYKRGACSGQGVGVEGWCCCWLIDGRAGELESQLQVASNAVDY